MGCYVFLYRSLLLSTTVLNDRWFWHSSYRLWKIIMLHLYDAEPSIVIVVSYVIYCTSHVCKFYIITFQWHK